MYYLLTEEMKMTLRKMILALRTEAQCQEFMKNVRWPDGIECPRCGAKTIFELKSVRKFECSNCKYQFSVTTGTFLHKTYLPLNKWLIAIYLIVNSEMSITASQLSHDLKIPYKTAWSVKSRISKAMAIHDNNNPIKWLERGV